MKKLELLLAISLAQLPISAQTSVPRAALTRDLYPRSLYEATVDLREGEVHAIQEHLGAVLERLRTREVSHLSEALRARRRAQIERLAVYRERGIFPHNDSVPGLTPVFIDDQGRSCAVAHLMLESGARELAEQVASHENLAYVPEISVAGVAQWIAGSGLDAQECAWIQPSYGGGGPLGFLFRSLRAADYVASPRSGDVPLTVSFENLSLRGACLWDFGDGVTSSLADPIHTYSTGGSFTVSLTVSNELGSFTERKIDHVEARVVIADFCGTPRDGSLPLAVSFTDLSANSPTTWSWDFGDGGTSSLQHPTHTYSSPGGYTVSLTASNAFTADTETRAGYIQAQELGRQIVGNGRIAFTSYRTSPGHYVYTMNADGSDETPFLATPGCYEPRWSPDGRSLLFVGYSVPYDTWLLRADGGVVGVIRPDSTRPTWGRSCPQEIVVVNDFDPRSIYAVGPHGATRLTDSGPGIQDTHPDWSERAQKIVFATNRDGNAEIYLMNPDGTGQVNITNHPANDGDVPATDGGAGPSWSPDGTRIAFESNRDGDFEIYLMNADGTGLTRLTFDPAKDTSPAWSPDGTMIVFTSYRTGAGDVYVMQADGTNQTRLTHDPAFDGQPDWQPRSRKVRQR